MGLLAKGGEEEEGNWGDNDSRPHLYSIVCMYGWRQPRPQPIGLYLGICKEKGGTTRFAPFFLTGCESMCTEIGFSSIQSALLWSRFWVQEQNMPF